MRSIVEMTIGRLKSRFAILTSEMRVEPQKASKIVVACAVLHNISLRFNVSAKFRHFEEADEEYCKAVKESNEVKEVNTVKGINLPNEAIAWKVCFFKHSSTTQAAASICTCLEYLTIFHFRTLVVKPRRRHPQTFRALTNPAVNLARTPTSKHCLMKASTNAPTELLRMFCRSGIC
ncbi:hypothetical protein TELCIR_14193 [Teladorsagia circumcincta]|uniref:DDE Tnp4 domain-containing protein n=1 Tax=Teladorsagia circumcincta TaxID=45464 RepID=A0A2G9U1N5_TELCI|nr:hypothetical protein TELCIR_14193 [Teladorsagia circumcincta]